MSVSPGKSEDICEQFQASWSWELSGVQGIGRFLSQASLSVDPEGELISRLVCIDMQNVWELWFDYVRDRHQSGVSASELLSHWAQLPKFSEYDVLYASQQIFESQRAELAGCESYCRDRWGDAIGPLYFEHYFKITTQEYMRRTRRLLRCEFETNSDYSQVLFPLRGCNAIGRQRTSDAESYFSKPGPDGNRIVVASRFEAEISRNQLTIQLLTSEIAVLTNDSRVNFIRVSADQILKPTDQLLVAFPFTIQLHGRKLYCY